MVRVVGVAIGVWDVTLASGQYEMAWLVGIMSSETSMDVCAFSGSAAILSLAFSKPMQFAELEAEAAQYQAIMRRW